MNRHRTNIDTSKHRNMRGKNLVIMTVYRWLTVTLFILQRSLTSRGGAVVLMFMGSFQRGARRRAGRFVMVALLPRLMAPFGKGDA